jgi:ribosomal protein S8E
MYRWQATQVTPSGTTYASFANIINVRSNDRTNMTVDQRIMRDGSVVPFNGSGVAAATIAKYIPETGHNIPYVFFTYLTKDDVIYVNGHTTQGDGLDLYHGVSH